MAREAAGFQFSAASPEITQKAAAHCGVALCYCFQFKMSLSKAAENLVHLPAKCLREPQSQPRPQTPFPAVRLRHVEGARREATLCPPPESEDASAAASSCRSAVQFMSRVLQRLREVEDHVSEVRTVCCCFFFFCSLCCMSRPPNRPQVQYWWCMTAEYTLRLKRVVRIWGQLLNYPW